MGEMRQKNPFATICVSKKWKHMAAECFPVYFIPPLILDGRIQKQAVAHFLFSTAGTCLQLHHRRRRRRSDYMRNMINPLPRTVAKRWVPLFFPLLFTLATVHRPEDIDQPPAPYPSIHPSLYPGGVFSTVSDILLLRCRADGITVSFPATRAIIWFSRPHPSQL